VHGQISLAVLIEALSVVVRRLGVEAPLSVSALAAGHLPYLTFHRANIVGNLLPVGLNSYEQRSRVAYIIQHRNNAGARRAEGADAKRRSR
jgi:hypothetical protein